MQRRRFIMILFALILKSERGQMLVRDCHTGQTILVHVRCACGFRAGNCVRITYSGAMTMSIPPQITAHSIRRVCPSLCRGCGGR